MLIQNDEMLVIFQYLHANYCNDSKITECCFKLRKQLMNIWMFSSQKKKTPYFFAFAIYDSAKKAKKGFAQADRAVGIKLQNNFKNMVFKLT